MANKKEREQRLLEEKNKQIASTQNKTLKFHGIMIALCAACLLCFFFNFAEVYNTAVGTEVKVSGWSFFSAAISGNFSSTGASYGDIAVPFYYYAKSYTTIVGTLSVVCVFLLILTLLVNIAVLATRSHSLTFLSLILSILSAILLLASYIVALLMKNAQILTIYCSNNPACSIRSYAIIPCLLAVAYCAVSALTCGKLIRAKKDAR